MLERFGLALTMSTPSIAVLAGGVTALAAPTFAGVVVTRAGESIFRGSWFRSSYELFYTPIPAVEKRAAKSVVDVAFDRLGDAVGGGLVRLALLITPVAAASTIMALALAGIGRRHHRRQPAESVVHPPARKEPRHAGRRPRAGGCRRCHAPRASPDST